MYVAPSVQQATALTACVTSFAPALVKEIVHRALRKASVSVGGTTKAGSAAAGKGKETTNEGVNRQEAQQGATTPSAASDGGHDKEEADKEAELVNVIRALPPANPAVTTGLAIEQQLVNSFCKAAESAVQDAQKVDGALDNVACSLRSLEPGVDDAEVARLLNWIYGIDLTATPVVPRTLPALCRQLKNGYLLADLLMSYFPGELTVYSFSSGQARVDRQSNWVKLRGFLGKKGVVLSQALVNTVQIQRSAPRAQQASVQILRAVYDMLRKCELIDQRFHRIPSKRIEPPPDPSVAVHSHDLVDVTVFDPDVDGAVDDEEDEHGEDSGAVEKQKQSAAETVRRASRVRTADTAWSELPLSHRGPTSVENGGTEELATPDDTAVAVTIVDSNKTKGATAHTTSPTAAGQFFDGRLGSRTGPRPGPGAAATVKHMQALRRRRRRQKLRQPAVLLSTDDEDPATATTTASSAAASASSSSSSSSTSPSSPIVDTWTDPGGAGPAGHKSGLGAREQSSGIMRTPSTPRESPSSLLTDDSAYSGEAGSVQSSSAATDASGAESDPANRKPRTPSRPPDGPRSPALRSPSAQRRLRMQPAR